MQLSNGHCLTLMASHLGIIHYFKHFHKSTKSTLGGGGKSSCMLSKMLILATVPVHETSLANQHFYSTHMGRREGVCKKSMLCTCMLVKMQKNMDGLLINAKLITTQLFTYNTGSSLRSDYAL